MHIIYCFDCRRLKMHKLLSLAAHDYSVFMANLDAFVADARSVTYIMQNEFDSIIGFEEWYSINRKK
jgi:hypothetical protein